MRLNNDRDHPTILVVDDSPHDFETYVRYLDKAKPDTYKIKLLPLGKDLFSSMHDHPHCLLLDLSLPDMTGLDILKKLKEDNHGSLPFPVIIITGSGNESSGRKALQLGAQDYLIKEEVTANTLQRSIEFATMRFKLEQQLRTSEERSRQLAASMKLAADAGELGFWSWETADDAIYADQNNRRMLGLPAHGSVTYTDFLNTLHQDDRATLTAAVEKCLQTGVSYDEEFRVQHPDGAIRWIATRGSLLRDAEGRATGMTGIAIDITDRKAATEALLENKERLRFALDAARMSTWDLDLVSDQVRWSETLEAQMSMAPGSFKGTYEAFQALVHPDDRDMVVSAVKRALDEHAELSYEFRMVRADGSIRWTESRGRASYDQYGKPVRLTGIDMDITDRKNRDEALQRSESRTRRLIESNIVPIVCATMDGFTEANDAFLHMLGLTRADFQDPKFSWETITPFEHLAKDHAALEQLKATGSCVPFEKEYIRRDGTRVPILIGATVLNTSPLEWLCFILDLSDLKQAEKQLRKSQSDLEQKVEERTSQLAVSLAAVESEVAVRRQAEQQLSELSAQLLRLQDEERRRIARDLHDSTGQTLSALKMTLGAMGRLVRGIPKTFELLEDAGSLVDQAVKDIRTLSYLLHPPLLDESGFASAARWYVEGFAKRSSIECSLDLAPEVRLAKTAELALFRVLQESLTNVSRHSGSKTAEIRLSPAGENALLSIGDTGKGLPAELLQNFARSGSGVGVGLAGMRQRLRDLGGELKLESSEQGTFVFATVPLAASAATDEGTDAQLGQSASSPV